MWLFVPNTSTSSPSAQVEPGLISESSWQFQALEQSAWSRGKHSRQRNWYQRCKRDISLQRLFGAMPEPSTADAGVDAWTASLAAYRASRTVLPESGSSAKTRATSGRPHVASSSSRARGSSSSRTSAACSPAAAPSGFGETFTDWALRVREDCSRRRRSARAMKGSASLSSQWPTATTNMVTGAGSSGRDGGDNLQTAVAMWPTPATRDYKGANSADHLANGTGRKHLDQLPNFVEHLWRTPTVGSENSMRGHGMTPETATKRIENGHTINLQDQVALWSTPSIADVDGGRMSRSGARSDELLMKGQAAAALSSRLVPMTYQVGGIPSKERRSLNPLFVEWLMGWPPGWTLLAWTDLGCSGMALCLWRQRMRSALSQLASPSAAPPAQLALFG